MALVFEAWQTGITVDEPSHLTSAYLYWQGRDCLWPCDFPPLVKIAGGWVTTLFRLPLPEDLGTRGDPRHEWDVALGMMEKLPTEQIRWLFFCSRLPLLIFPLLTALLIWMWGRELFRPAVGLLLAGVYAVEPTALAHGGLFKNDIAATFGYLLFWYCVWKFWRKPRLSLAIWVAVAAFLAAIAKLSMLILLPLAPCLVLLGYAAYRKAPVWQAAVAVILAISIPYAGILAANQLEMHRLTALELARYESMRILPQPYLHWIQVFHILPVARPMWNGAISLLQNNSDQQPVYLLGKVYPHGTIFYFIAALAVKIPGALEVLLCAGAVLVALATKRRRFLFSHIFWLAPGILYIALASLSGIQLGVRLVLPALPFGLLLCGVAMDRLLDKGPPRIVLACLLAWLAFTAIRIYPRGISYFNVWTGGPENGLEYLADSNLDWGQGLSDLAQYARKNGIHKLGLSYFGADNPFRFFSDRELEIIPPPWAGGAKRKSEPPAPGYYAISASLLPGEFFQPPYRDYYEVFRKMKPITKANYSIYVYRIVDPSQENSPHGSAGKLSPPLTAAGQ